ncbi:sigma-54-dependent Fis family transcriptional regulator [Alkalicoccus halolimnae]|uniref:Sigma-54-dependent Fis family transcriptional regulator n=1 Tax=Alkalicoccus halolimnae TaxID=1667239 RepID=A0AAJ8N3C8_9BACI|nr:sigma-54-dependent Fis family transcriptional regulator [Alkalicoccus halolimnae]
MEQLIINESWKRCQQSGSSPTDAALDLRLTGKELHDLLERNEPLLKHLRPVFEQIQRTVHDREYLAAVVNAEGFILSRAGGIRIRQIDERLEVGTNWSEENKGTNAMGVVLHERKSALIHGDHHFYEENHVLTCAASPLYDADGVFCGAVNISTTKENYHPLLLSWTKAVADSVHSKMTAEKLKQERPVMLESPPGKNNPENLYTFQNIAGSCENITAVKKLAKRAALTDYPVIIYGESGTGKELLAQSIHSGGDRAERIFVPLNCSALPESLIESELFGYEKGAFTGASQRGKAGKFEAADGGTIFLDEVGDLSLKAQSALLRVLQEKTITRIGGYKQISVNVRILSATNKNLRTEIAAGRFREDLYYRLKGIYLTMPPLRNRSDICEIAEFLLKKMESNSRILSEEAKAKLMHYSWPGNIRELESVLMQGSFLSEGKRIEAEAIQFEEEYEIKRSPVLSLEEAESETIRHALEAVDGNISKAAERLHVGRNTLYSKLKKYDISY